MQWPPLPPYQPTSDPCALLSYILSTLLRIEDATRISEYAFSTPTQTTTGTGTTFAAADTWGHGQPQALPLQARYGTLMLWDNSAIIQVANDRFPEWQAHQLSLRAPGTYAMPLRMKSFRIRALNATYQAKYSLLVMD